MQKIKSYVLIVFIIIFSAKIFAGPVRNILFEDNNPGSSRQPSEIHYPYGKVDVPVGVRLLSNIAYGVAERQRLDVYLPKQGGNSPVIFMVHGGAWKIGDKTAPRVVQNKLNYWVAQKGFVLVSTNYRLLPGADPAQQLQDIARALAFAQSKAAGWGADPEKFILMGHSAGGHLISMLTVKPSIALVFGAQPWLGAVALDNPAFDIVQIMQRKHYEFYDDAFGNTIDYWRSMSPMHVLRATEAESVSPMMAVCSIRRPDKPCDQVKQFADAAKKLNIRVEILPQDKSHADINGDLGVPGVYTDAVEKFINSLL